MPGDTTPSKQKERLQPYNNGRDHQWMGNNQTIQSGTEPDRLDRQEMQHALSNPALANPGAILSLQRAAGNRAVSRFIQAKLVVGAAGDAYEQEADRTAEQVISMPALVQGRGAKAVQMKSAASASSHPLGSFEVSPEIEQRISASQGIPLPGDVRSFMEPRFGVDFSGVRVHTGSGADQLNRSLSAQAFTHGQDIFVSNSRYDPGSTAGKRLLAHELTHVVQQTGGIHRWAEQEHKSFGDLAGAMAAQHDWTIQAGSQSITPFGMNQARTSQVTGSQEERDKYQQFLTQKVDPLKGKLTQSLHDQENINVPQQGGIGVAHMQGEQKRFMSFGDATMLGGDYYKTAEATGVGRSAGLAQAETINPYQRQGMMVVIAATNINHFWPVAGREFQGQYMSAMEKAARARVLYGMGDKAGGDREAEVGFRYLGVALHFLQDTFASGHQYPHALNDIDSVTAAGIMAEGAFEAKSYHDALCALPHGLPMLYGQRFHGDTTADGSDYPVVIETYRAILHFMSVMTNKPVPGNAPPARYNPGPDTGQILADPEAGPLWRSMLTHISGKLETARDKAKPSFKNNFRQTSFTTPAGTRYTAEELKDEWDKLNTAGPQSSSQVDKLVAAAMKNQHSAVFSKTKGDTMTGIGKSMNMTADVEIRNIIKDGVPKLTHNQTVMVIGTLITGVCSRWDEQAVLKILEAQDDAVVLSVVKEITPERIDSGLDFSAWDSFLTLWASRGENGNNPGAEYIIKENNKPAARALVALLDEKKRMDRVSDDQWRRIMAFLKGRSFFHRGENDEAISKIREQLHMGAEEPVKK